MSEYPCMDCCRKHIGTAWALYFEAMGGYPWYRTKVVGELVEAERESMAHNPKFAEKIRECRRKISSSFEAMADVCLEDLAIEAEFVAGEGEALLRRLTPSANKKFDIIDRLRKEYGFC